MQRGKYGHDQFDDKPFHKGNQIAVVQPGSPLSFELNGAMDGDRVDLDHAFLTMHSFWFSQEDALVADPIT
jgi:hypothetical protein